MQRDLNRIDPCRRLPPPPRAAASRPGRNQVAFSSQPDFERYEREKLAFIVFDPNATPLQYEEAMAAIAKRCRV
jgi:hypothetical protein